MDRFFFTTALLTSYIICFIITSHEYKTSTSRRIRVSGTTFQTNFVRQCTHACTSFARNRFSNARDRSRRFRVRNYVTISAVRRAASIAVPAGFSLFSLSQKLGSNRRDGTRRDPIPFGPVRPRRRRAGERAEGSSVAPSIGPSIAPHRSRR